MDCPATFHLPSWEAVSAVIPYGVPRTRLPSTSWLPISRIGRRAPARGGGDYRIVVHLTPTKIGPTERECFGGDPLFS